MEDDSSPPGYSQPLGTNLPRSSLPKQEDHHHQRDEVGIEKADKIKDVPYSPLSSPAYVPPPMAEQPKAVNPIEGYSIEEEAIREKPDISMANTVRFEEDPPDAPKTRPQDQIPTNYETKVANPTGTKEIEASSPKKKEIEASSIIHKLGQMDISDKSQPEAEAGELNSLQPDQSIFPTGSHDQCSPGPTPPIPIISSDEIPQSIPQQSNASKSEDHRAEKGPIQPGPTPPIPIISSDEIPQSIPQESNASKSEDHRAEKGSIQPGPTSPIPIISSHEIPQSNPQQSNASKSEDDRAEKGPIQTSYTQKIAYGTSAIADKAISAKNMVASKLGYGAKDHAKEEHDVQQKNETEKTEKKLGKVTESEKVKEQLGTKEESDVNIPASTVVSKLKEVVGSYFGEGGETRSSAQEESLGSNDSGGFPGSLNEEETREKRLQDDPGN